VADDSTETNLRDLDAEFDVDVELIQKQTDYLSTSAEEFDDRAVEDVETLYHYTDVNGLMSILTKHDLWATNVFFMNDESEIRHSFDKVNAMLTNTELPMSLVGTPHTVADRVIKTITNNFAQYVNLYAVCFCESGDLLSQWRAYGANGGYAIGFDASQLRKLTSRRFALIKVSYDEEEQDLALAKLIRKWRDCFTDDAGNVHYSNSTLRALELMFAEIISMVGLGFKNKGFSEEEEWRLVYRKSEIVLDDGINFPIDFRARNGNPVPYARISFNRDESANDFRKPIQYVVMGRRNYSVVTGFALVKFLLSLGGWHQDIGIRQSAIPLRAWST
jgi:hypothetical protein